jgi:hypothetical protein
MEIGAIGRRLARASRSASAAVCVALPVEEAGWFM